MPNGRDTAALPRLYAWFSALVADDIHGLESLLAHGVPVDAEHPLRHTTALMEAARLNRTALIEWLLKHGANPALLCGLPKGSPLHAAIALRHWRAATLLVNALPSITLVDAHGRTPLHQMCMEWLEGACLTHSLTLAELLIAKHCPLDAIDGEGITALHYCIINEQERLAALLLAHGANPNVTTPDSRVSPLLIAAMEKHTALCQLLLDHGADPTLSSHDGNAPANLMPHLARIARGTVRPRIVSTPEPLLNPNSANN